MTSLKMDEWFWCTYFLTNLDGNTGTWFKTLHPWRINKYGQLKYILLANFMQLWKYKGYSHSIIRCKQKEGEIVRDYFSGFINATLDVPGHDEGLVAGAFAWGFLVGPLSQKLKGKKPQTLVELKENVEWYICHEEDEASNQAYLNATTTSTTKQHTQPNSHQERHGENKYHGRGQHSQGRFRSFMRDNRRGRRPIIQKRKLKWWNFLK